jgi:hypothetical protein
LADRRARHDVVLGTCLHQVLAWPVVHATDVTGQAEAAPASSQRLAAGTDA